MPCIKPFFNVNAFLPWCELEGNLFLAMYQVGMLTFTNEVEWYCKELSNSSATHASNIPTTSSTPFSAEKLEAIEQNEAYWTGNSR